MNNPIAWNSHLYVFVDGPFCKIGTTNNPKRRAQELWYPSWKPGTPRQAPIKRVWHLPDCSMRVELAVYRAFGHRSIQPGGGGDWFKVTEIGMLRVINRALREFGKSGRKPGRRPKVAPPAFVTPISKTVKAKRAKKRKAKAAKRKRRK